MRKRKTAAVALPLLSGQVDCPLAVVNEQLALIQECRAQQRKLPLVGDDLNGYQLSKPIQVGYKSFKRDFGAVGKDRIRFDERSVQIQFFDQC